MPARRLDAAREHLLSEGTIPDHLAASVRPQVLQSWKRSLLSGAQLASPALVFKGDHHVRAALRMAADPVLSRLAEQLSGLDAGVLLADHEATLVRRWVPDRSMVPLLDKINAHSGFNNSEEFIGTNGTGSPVEQGTAMQISGPEHLAEALRPFTCVGVPVHHPITRRLEGVITLTCRAMSGNPLLTPLMTNTALEVESRLLAQASTDERHLLDEYLVAIGSRRTPVAAVGQDIFIAGPKVTDHLEGVDRALLWEYVRAVARGGRPPSAEHAHLSDRVRIVRCRPVERDGTIVGALVEFDLDNAPEPALLGPPPTLPLLVLPGKSPALAQAVTQATRLAAHNVPILIEGESGVGKTTLARRVLESVHAASVAVVDVCTVVGTSGSGSVAGLLRRALDASPDALILTHLEALDRHDAAAVCAVLEANELTESPVRVVATLLAGTRIEGELRRLVDTVGVGRVTLPPLRDRTEDIAPTAAAILDKHRRDKPLRFSSAALRCLMRAPWPGNLRQLDATIRGLVSTTIGPEIRPEALPLDLQGSSRKRDLSAIEELELSAILTALREHHGNKVAAAHAIGISRSTLYRKLHAYRLDPDQQYF